MYIRTKDGVFELANEKTITEFQIIDHLHNRAFLKNEIIATADTIEELCDEFVIEYIASDVLFQVRYAEFQWAEEEFESDKKETLYGAIRVAGKGLIYVAKMNENGELVLI